jgi:hypothetical protein
MIKRTFATALVMLVCVSASAAQPDSAEALRRALLVQHRLDKLGKWHQAMGFLNVLGGLGFFVAGITSLERVGGSAAWFFVPAVACGTLGVVEIQIGKAVQFKPN